MAGQLLFTSLEPALRVLRPKPAGKPEHPEFSWREVHGTCRVEEETGAPEGRSDSGQLKTARLHPETEEWND